MKKCCKWFALIYACSERHYQESSDLLFVLIPKLSLAKTNTQFQGSGTIAASFPLDFLQGPSSCDFFDRY